MQTKGPVEHVRAGEVVDGEGVGGPGVGLHVKATMDRVLFRKLGKKVVEGVLVTCVSRVC